MFSSVKWTSWLHDVLMRMIHDTVFQLLAWAFGPPLCAGARGCAGPGIYTWFPYHQGVLSLELEPECKLQVTPVSSVSLLRNWGWGPAGHPGG